MKKVIVNKRNEVLERKIDLPGHFTKVQADENIMAGLYSSEQLSKDVLIKILEVAGQSVEPVFESKSTVWIEHNGRLKELSKTHWNISGESPRWSKSAYKVKELIDLEVDFNNQWNSSQFKLKIPSFEFFARRTDNKPWFNEGEVFIDILTGEIIYGDDFLRHVSKSETGITNWYAGEVPANYYHIPQLDVKNHRKSFRYENVFCHIKWVNGKYVAVVNNPATLEIFLTPLKGLKYLLPNLTDLKTDFLNQFSKNYEIIDVDEEGNKIINQIMLYDLTNNFKATPRNVRRLARKVWRFPAPNEISEPNFIGDLYKKWNYYNDFDSEFEFYYKLNDNCNEFEIVTFNSNSYNYQIQTISAHTLSETEKYAVFFHENYNYYIYNYRNVITVYNYNEKEEKKSGCLKARLKAKKRWIREKKNQRLREQRKKKIKEEINELRKYIKTNASSSNSKYLSKEDAFDAGMCKTGTNGFIKKYFRESKEQYSFKEISNNENFETMLKVKDFREVIKHKKIS